ncbi:MAG: hypothetical protein V5A27_10830 [Halapricum sp.]
MPNRRTGVVAVAVVSVGLALGLVVAGVAPVGSDDASNDQGVAVESIAGNTTVTVTYTNASGASRQFVVSDVDPRLTDAVHGWAIVEHSSLPPALRDDDVRNGVVRFGEWALVGATKSATVAVDGTELTVVVPQGRDVDPGRKAGFVREFADPYSLSQDGDDPIVLVSVPDALPSEGLMYHDDRGYVTIQAFWDGDAHSVWIHEYVHARQDFRTAPGMVWFREASARYLSYRFMQEQYEGVSQADVRQQLDSYPVYDGVTLANRTTWEGTEANYHEGARLLATVDTEIRAESGGSHSLVDVFRAMNTEEEPITVERFVALVERYADDDQSWIADAIRGNERVKDRMRRP